MAVAMHAGSRRQLARQGGRSPLPAARGLACSFQRRRYIDRKQFQRHSGPAVCAVGGQLNAQVAVVLGSQWGDEGKGKLVDILAQQYDIIARAQVLFKAFLRVRSDTTAFIALLCKNVWRMLALEILSQFMGFLARTVAAVLCLAGS